MQVCQLVGQFKVSTNSRGNPKGKSNAPTQFLLSLSHAVNPSSELICSIFNSTTRLLFADPMAKTIGFFLLGLLEKSQPMTCVTSQNSRAPNDGSCRHQFLEQRHRDCSRGAVRVKLRFFGIFQQNRMVDFRHIDLPHGPAAETAL